MRRNALAHPFTKWWHDKRFLTLLIGLLLLILTSPFLQGFGWFEVFRKVLMSWVFIEIFHSTATEYRRAVVGLFLVLFAILAVWADYAFESGPATTAVTTFFIVTSLLFSIAILSKYIIHADRVDSNVIYISIIIYLLISMVWAFFYAVLEALVPGSFLMPFETIQSDTMHWFFYFSFVTITTLGYGDITPLNAKASMLASSEALIGQIYLVVIVAWLVGMHVSERSRQ
jgi:hypothetical protein